MWPRSWSAEGPMRWRAPWSRVTRTEPEVFDAHGEEKHLVAVMDYGVKQNMIECLRRRGCQVVALPASTPPRGALQAALTA